jgi:glycosidase
MPKLGLSKFSYRPHPHLYEINTYAWLEELSAKVKQFITLRDVPDSEWDRLQKLGFDFVYLMGMWHRSAIGRDIFRTNPAEFPNFDAALPGWKLADVVGSPYSIQDYAPDPRIGTFDDLAATCRKLRDRGMGLILDFVPNHTGFDHPWVEKYPERYILGSEQDFRRNPDNFYLLEKDKPVFIARGKDPYFAPWRDVAQLNYFNPATRVGMIDILKAISQYCDGVRCDMAMLVTNEVFSRTWSGFLTKWPAPATEFWQDAIPQIPGFVWLAEVYWDMEWKMQQLGFNFAYDKRLYDRLRGTPPSEVRAHLVADLGYQSKLARFLENHDEPRGAATFPHEKQASLALMISTLPGMRFFHHGQLEGKKVHIPMPLARAADEPVDQEIQNAYQKVLALANSDLFHKGEWRLLEVRSAGDDTCNDLLAYRWRLNQECSVIVANLGARTAQGLVQQIDADTTQNLWFCDQLSGKKYVYKRDNLEKQGLYVRLERNQAHAFTVQPA